MRLSLASESDGMKRKSVALFLPSHFPIFLAVLFLSFNWSIIHVEGACPNHCNGKGTCDKYARCTCALGYTGADCSLRTCPVGIAWSDFPTATDTAHAITECSNRGICDRASGVCACMQGFTGAACDRLTCQSSCSNQGKCYSMRDFALRTRDSNSNSRLYTTNWDANMIHGCACDYRFTGYDCSLRVCPDGDDPLTTGQVNEIQLLKCVAIGGSFVLYYKGIPSTNIPFNANAAMVIQALLSIPLISAVTVTFSQPNSQVCQAAANVVQIQFTEQFGPQPPLVPLTDSVMMANGGSVTIAADGLTSFVDASGTKFVSVKGTKEADACANRGICSYIDGTCTCFLTNGDGYGSSNGYGMAGTRGECGFITTGVTVSSCPGEVQCSGHGVCNTQTYRCSCSAGWTGGDCSERTCPLGLSWFDYPVSDNVAHTSLVPCSNMGLCDPTTGKCTCRLGFYGAACDYMACGGGVSSPCNGHGRCMTMAEAAIWADDNGNALSITYGQNPNNPVTWDGQRSQVCLCDKGWEGYDCSLKSCPIGDDPGTYDQHNEVQLLQCVATSGTFTLSFRQQVTGPLPFNATADMIVEALEGLSTIGTQGVTVLFLKDGQTLPDAADKVLHFTKPLKVTEGRFPQWGSFDPVTHLFTFVAPTVLPPITPSGACTSDSSQVVVIQFDTVHGNLPPLIADTKNLVLSPTKAGSIKIFSDGDSVTSPSGVKLTSIQGTTETAVCNNRGICDYTTGHCTCFNDWSSSDGMGGPGYLNDCGYRKVDKFPGGPYNNPNIQIAAVDGLEK